MTEATTTDDMYRSLHDYPSVRGIGPMDMGLIYFTVESTLTRKMIDDLNSHGWDIESVSREDGYMGHDLKVGIRRNTQFKSDEQ